jgi:hypothetical protein
MIALIPLVGYDVIANVSYFAVESKCLLTTAQVYLTLLFMIPLFHAYSFKNRLKSNNLRRTALRAFSGGCVTLVSSVTNLLTLLILRGEQSWICLLCCNSDGKIVMH